MLITVDIGNTTILCAGMEDKQALFSFRMSTDKAKSAAEYTVKLREMVQVYVGDVMVLRESGGVVRTEVLCEDGTLHTLTGAVMSSVVPELTGALEQAVAKIFGVKTVVVKRDIMPDFPIDLDYPASIGSDRVADAAAVAAEYPLPAIVFDLGTATTCSVIDEGPVFRGGLISPGVRTASNALLAKASQLTSYELGEPTALVGKNTEEAINSGIVYGHASMIDGLVRRIERATGKTYTVVLTGGLSGLIGKYCDCDIRIDEFLILKGLWYLYEMWEKKQNIA